MTMGTMQWQSGMSMCEMRLVKQSCESQMVPPRIFLASVSYQNVITVATRMHTRTHAHSARARNHTHTHTVAVNARTHTHTIAVNARTRAHTHTHNHTHTPHKHARDRDKGKDRIPINIYILLQTFLRQTATTPCASLSQSDTQRELKKKNSTK